MDLGRPRCSKQMDRRSVRYRPEKKAWNHRSKVVDASSELAICHALSLQEIQKLPQGHDPNAVELAEIEHQPVSRDNELRTRGDRAFQNPVVRLIAKYVELSPWPHHVPEVREKDSDPRQFLRVAIKLPRKHAQEFMNDGPRDGQFEPAVERVENCLRSLPARQRERGDENIGVEDRLHPRR